MAAELDADNRAIVMGLLLSAAATGRLVVIASHDNEVTDACDRVVRMIDGKVTNGGDEAGFANPTELAD